MDDSREAIPYGERRTTDSIVCYANSDACPYSGFVRKVIAIPYGVRRMTGDHIGSPLQKQGLREANAFRTVYVSRSHVVCGAIAGF